MTEILFDQEQFEAVTRRNLEELSNLVAEYDQQAQESELAEFSKHDPLQSIIRAIAAKFRAEEGLKPEESLQQADQIVRSAEDEVKKPSAKQKICAALKSFSGDSLALLPILLELAKSGSIAIAFDPTGTFLVSAACLIVVKLGVEGFCTE